MSTTIPTNTEVLRYLEESPDRVASFANQLFSSCNFSEPELIEIAGKLLRRTSDAFRPHLWESFGQAIRRLEIQCHSEWFLLARTRLEVEDLSSEEAGAIRDFLSDLRMFSMDLNKIGFAMAESEWEWYVGVNHMARSAGKSELRDCIAALDSASTSRSFLVRESVVESLGILWTRSDLYDQDLMPFRIQFKELLSLLSGDHHWFVRQSLETILPLLGLEANM